MNLTELARFYFRYYDKINASTFRLADNAPGPWHQFMSTLPDSYRKLAPLVLEQMINRTAYPALPLETYLNWVAENPNWVAKADAILSQKTPTKSFMELLDKIYRSELRVTKDIVTNYLNEQLIR